MTPFTEILIGSRRENISRVIGVVTLPFMATQGNHGSQRLAKRTHAERALPRLPPLKIRPFQKKD